MIARWLPRLAVLLLLALLFCCGSLAAQAMRLVHKDPLGDGDVTVVTTVSGGAYRGVGLGFARVEIENAGAKAKRVQIVLGQPSHFSGDVSSRRELLAEPGLTQFFLPIEVMPMRCRLEVTIDGERRVQSAASPGGSGAVGLLVSERSGRRSFGVRILELVPSAYVGVAPELIEMGPRELPTDWRMLTTFSMITVDGDWVDSMSGELQEALRRYAYAGGTVAIASPEALPAGVLRDLAEQARQQVLQHGLGYVIGLPPFGRDTTSSEALLTQVPTLGAALWPASPELFPVQEIEGLGKAPVTVFVLIILCFAVLVGPVNFLMLRRRKQPLLALLTVPVLGFGTTLVILAYGIMHDGFAVRGVARSCTLLDQGNHQAVSVNLASLFAGMAPSDLTMAADSMLLSVRAGFDSEKYLDRWSWDANSQRLDGGVLPSRTVTPLLSVQQGPVRERLTVRERGDALEVLLDGGIEPVGQLVLCDLEGQHWLGSSGRLQRCSAAEGQRVFALLRDRARTVRAEEPGSVRNVALPLAMPTWGQPGTYATQVRKAPWLDDHGIAVDYDDTSHFVFGRMQAEDFVR